MSILKREISYFMMPTGVIVGKFTSTVKVFGITVYRCHSVIGNTGKSK